MAEPFDADLLRQWMHAIQQDMANFRAEWQQFHQQQQQQQHQHQNHPEPGNGLRVQIKLPAPEGFSGSPSSISASQWVAAMEHYLALTRVTVDRERIIATAGFLKLSALGWWLQNKEELVEGTWDAFKEAFLRYFQPVNAAETARARLFGLKQAPGFSGYNIYRDRFHRLLAEIPNMSEEEKLSHFKNGLLPETKKFVLLQKPKTCHEAMEMGGLVEEATRSSNPSGFRSFGRGPVGRPPGRGVPTGAPSGTSFAGRGPTAGPSNQGPAPMELGSHLIPGAYAMNSPSPSQNPNYLCFLCGGRGHGVARCPMLNRARAALGKPPLRMQPRPNFGRPQFQTQVLEDESGVRLEYNEGEYWEVEELVEEYADSAVPEGTEAEEADSFD